MKSLRILALDHYFDQDLRALAANPRLDVRRIPYQRLRGPALRIMGKAVGTGLRAYNDPAIAAARSRYAAWLSREVERLYLERPFDIIVLPSDTFFYVRALPAAAHRLGIPVMVVQKETTISRATMERFSAEVATQAPFISDAMTVCSDRQKQFWTRAGADPDLVEVTGQPRFDMYASRPGAAAAPRRRLLFLTYALDAYVPGAGRGKGLRTWRPLRDATESVLLEAARTGTCEVVVKCHPQQHRRAEVARLEQLAGNTWEHGIQVAAQDADTRELIMAADIVIGFQTTALYEAVAAHRCAIYAAWGEEYERHRSGLIPFDEAPADCVRHATSAQALAALLTEVCAPRASCAAWYEEALGTVDGHAADRVAERVAIVAGAGHATGERLDIERRRRRFAVGLLARSVAAEALWTAAIPAAKIAGEQRRVAVRRQRAREGRALANESLRRAH
jgi:hypothetical protein